MVSITPTDLAEHLAEILARVEQGESFVVADDGRKVAVLSPAESSEEGITREELAAALAGFLPVGGGFADDLEAIINEQSLSESIPWPSS